jgi:metal-responsive CopG/Arc/MetJ family transcriptional regulator
MEEKPSTLFIGVKCEPALVSELDKLARRRFVSRSDCVRSLLRAGLDQEQRDSRQVGAAA